ncbi:MAG TPA: hypothetical protein VMB91_13135 [Solirubrobacteraceae bacterium]|nr:hypothetical protein [Solirubrobacteraceae bacterium]
MSDYFDHVERSLREAVRERRHAPWLARVLSHRSRPALVAVVALLGGGTALAATGVLQTGAPVSSEVRATPNAGEGTVIASSVRLLPLRVPDPGGGPPWGLRAARTSRGLLCVEVGRVVGGRIGVLGRDGAFHDDGAFHPFGETYLPGVGCGTEDARGDAFTNVQLHGIPASGQLDNRRYTSGGCYGGSASAAACPPSQLRDVYFGMLGPDATGVTALDGHGHTSVSATSSPSGAYLVVVPHREPRCQPGAVFCVHNSGDHYYTSSPTLPVNEAVTAIAYRDAPPCRLPDPAEQLEQERADALRVRETLRGENRDIYTKLYRSGRLQPGAIATLSPRQIAELQDVRGPLREPSCPDVGFVAPSGSQARLTAAELASPVTARLQRARHYCERGQGESVVPCEHHVPRGYKRMAMPGPPEALLTVDFTAREPVTNFDSHYEIETTTPVDPRHPGFQEGCGGTFGPTQRNLRAGQLVRHTSFMNAHCHGRTVVTVAYVTVNGPSGAQPVPGLPGQSSPIPVGKTAVTLP